ncbi:hypothetical protein AZ014_002555, partial [Klebsiella pneumoniae]
SCAASCWRRPTRAANCSRCALTTCRRCRSCRWISITTKPSRWGCR